ncbi:PREDICTED: delta(24)-sterol reductase-like [Nicrophorus vespilloides]|uniref:Delta(24)-sterol reductase n=1 Tax=Nicrophorus vespilloides TaxID=110193 RepID=A0ABM1N046_NICVS|nr:PREDICTED: delta(24)-sterol reductase-like [Nicrophorus vespilloides]
MATTMAYKPKGIFEYILIKYRWIFVCFFLLPVSFVYDGLMHLRNWIVFRLNSAPDQHTTKVERVQKQVLDWIESGRTRRMCTARPGWQTVSFRRPAYKGSLHQIDVNLVDILEIDYERKVLRVEPMVTMGQLTSTLNPLGWTIPVLPEIDDLTIGGLVMGTGIESTSHKHGLFQHICVSYELVLCDGSVVKCTKDENHELFESVPWSYGTLGFLTAVEIMMVPAKKYVRLKYEAVNGCATMVEEFEKASADPGNEFVEGIMFSENQGVIMTGNLTDTPEHNKVNSIGNWYKPWFFVHVRNMLGRESAIEYIPLRDYYHRHTRSIFWELQVCNVSDFIHSSLFFYS